MTHSTILWKTNDDGSQTEIPLPTRKEVCPRCEGEGSICNPNIGVITAEEWERDWDEESQQMYMSGGFDVGCPECKGLRVVDIVDVDRLSPEDRAAYEKQCREEDDYAIMVEAERRMGA